MSMYKWLPSFSILLMSVLAVSAPAHAQTEVIFDMETYKEQRQAKTERHLQRQKSRQEYNQKTKVMCDELLGSELTQKQKKQCSQLQTRLERRELYTAMKIKNFMLVKSKNLPKIIDIVRTHEDALSEWKLNMDLTLSEMKGKKLQNGETKIAIGYGLEVETVPSHEYMQVSHFFNAIAAPVLKAHNCKIIESHALPPYLEDHTFSGQITLAKCGELSFLTKDYDYDLIKHRSARRYIAPELRNFPVGTGSASVGYVKDKTGDNKVRYSWAKHGRYMSVTMNFNDRKINKETAFKKGDEMFTGMVDYYIKNEL